MRLLAIVAFLAGGVSACGGSSKPSESPKTAEPVGEPDASAPDAEAMTTLTAPPPEAQKAPSKESYGKATAKPEQIDLNDDSPQLNDDQLTGPMHGVLDKCKVPKNAHVTIQTAVQNGRAIGVSVDVAFDQPKPSNPPKRMTKAAAAAAAATAKAEAKSRQRIVACADKAVRAVTWPPSKRRDTFVTIF